MPPEILTAPAVGRPLIAATAVPALAIALWCNAPASGLLLPVAVEQRVRGTCGRRTVSRAGQ